MKHCKKFKKSFFKTFFVLLSLIISSIQLIDLIKEYLSYPTVQTVASGALGLSLPSITFCHQSRHNMLSFVEDVECNIKVKNHKITDFCNKSRHSVMYSKKDNEFCVTYFSQLLPENANLQRIISNYSKFSFKTSYIINKASLHSPLMPPQMSQLDSVGCFFVRNFKQTETVLLPAPYDTNCFNYSYRTRFRSQYDCQLHCQQKALFKDRFKELSTLWQNSTNSVFKTKTHSNRFCLKVCQKQCFNSYYQISLFEEAIGLLCNESDELKGKIPRFYYERESENNFILNLEKMSLIYVFIQSGGLLNLWFGFAFIQLAQFLKYRITAKEITFILYLLFNVICIFQIISVTKAYFKYGIVTNVLICDNYDTVGVMPRIDLVDAIDLPLRCFIFMTNNSIFEIGIYTIITQSDRDIISYHYSLRQLDIVDYYIYDVYNSSIPDFRSPRHIRPLLIMGGLVFPLRVLIIEEFGICSIKVTQKTFKHLSPPFEVYCLPEAEEAYLNQIHDGHQLCYQKCLENKLQNKFNCSASMEDTYFTSNDSYIFGETKKLCDWNEIQKARKEIGNGLCIKHCKLLCVKQEYQITTKLIEKFDSNSQVTIVRFEFDKNDFVVVYESLPQMTLFDWFYESCSLASLWLNLSLIHI